MTEETDRFSRPECPVQSNEGGTSSEEWSRDAWESLDSDPNDSDDLGYDIRDWEQFETLDNTDQVIFLPSDEAQLEDAAFVVAEDTTVLALENHC